ncbi:hypothetical protein J6590_041449 [Homalodisca vitripennis]|nr:hypothetical protein J6590_041449 [Homalodisca vitripennis]
MKTTLVSLGPRECRQRNGAASLPNGNILKPKWNARALPALLYRHPTGAPVFILKKCEQLDESSDGRVECQTQLAGESSSFGGEKQLLDSPDPHHRRFSTNNSPVYSPNVDSQQIEFHVVLHCSSIDNLVKDLGKEGFGIGESGVISHTGAISHNLLFGTAVDLDCVGQCCSLSAKSTSFPSVEISSQH